LESETLAEKIKGFCPTCLRAQNATVLARHKNREFAPDDDSIFVQHDHYILKCGGCDTIFHRHDSAFSEDTEDDGRPRVETEYWPSESKRERPDWLGVDLMAADQLLYKLTISIYTALDHDLPVLAAIGMRTAFDRASELLGIDTEKPFNKKLDELVASGKVGTSERANLAALVEAGSAAAHRAWEPSKAELDTMMTILEHFLYRAFIIDHQAKTLKVPARKPRKP
jgi:hypothetical protein